ncbi:MAG: DNA repair protein RecN [Muribaculaceae bacterium]|nr:DNA repair protein RecN [Muribaculaceae bacterium]
MLQSLQISNYALIDRVEIDFAPGLNIITGETGAGKSIMLGALSLILGERADTRVVADHGAKSIIEATFAVDRYPRLKQFCIDNDIEWDDAVCILRREISPAGRSRAFINDSPVTLTLLRGVAMQLVDIHSQHQNLLLARPDYQMQILDSLAGNDERLAVHLTNFNAYRKALKRLKATKMRIEQDRQNEEFTRYQLDQLEELALVAGEQEELENRREILANLTDLKTSLLSALDLLSDGRVNAIEQINDAIGSVNAISPILPAKATIPERLESLSIELSDIVDTLQSANEQLQADPAELEEIEQRLGLIYSMEHRHNVDTVEALIAIRDDLAGRLSQLDDSEDNLAALEKEARRARALARESAAAITAARVEAGRRLAERLKELASPLGMKNLQCEIQITPADLSATGADAVAFLFSFNKNQKPMPVGDTASGGEISRLMLCVKSIIASHMQLPSIIFDEIDTGVSGDVASRMGRMMLDLSANIQVTAITHLPQVAARGVSHFKVYKEDDEHSTHTRISRLDDDARVDEIAVMLSGSSVSPEARANALALLNNKSN